METHTNVSYSQTMKEGKEVAKKIRYDVSQVESNRLINTCYTSTVENNRLQESFNKLMQYTDNVYQQIGNSTNGEDWSIKEFSNDELCREFTDAYDKHKFDRPLIESAKQVTPMKPSEGILTRLYSLARK